MPTDIWGPTRPAVARHGSGYSLPLRLTQTGEGTEEDPTRWEGVRVETPSLTRLDVIQAVHQDPDATEDDLVEALGLALDEQAPTLQAQIDELTNIALGGE